jgi:tetratricopeptide (TPR) repeat protein
LRPYNFIEARPKKSNEREAESRKPKAESRKPKAELRIMGKSRQNLKHQSGPWIYNPWLDLIVGCGAWSAPLLLISYFAVASSVRTWSVVFYVLALFFNYPHYMATIYRAYHRSEDFHKYRVFTVHITALVVLTLLLSHFWLRLLPWIFTIYLTWSPWHYSGQNYGLFMMFARRAGADPDKACRRALYGAFVVSYLILFLGFHTGPSSDPLFLSLGIPAVIGKWEQVGLGAAFIALSIFGLSRLARDTGWKKLTPSLTLFSSQFLWFLLPTSISLIKGLAVPQNRYSTGVLAVMHSAQYLWITSYYARREATQNPAENNAPNWRPLAYFGILVLGGIALFVPGPWLASRAFHHDFTVSFLIFTALVNIHHFILDGAIWKLRDGRIASLLLNSRESISNAATDAGGRLAAAARWLVGSSPASRFVRVSAAVLLLIWGTVDQARYYLSLQRDNLDDLQRAAKLDSFDSSVQLHLGERAIADGDMQQAETAWRQAIEANPSDPAPRQALLQFLISQNRYDEAFDLTEASLQYAPKDANLLLDRGLLEIHRGRPADARSSWEQALAADPSQITAHLYLADELDREGQAAAAASQYNAYLQKISRQPGKDRPPADRVIAIVLRMAACQARLSQTELASKSYQLAENLAAQTKQPRLESVAAVSEAALQFQAGHLSEALKLYQHALQLDSSAGDENASVEDWLNYGRFLDAAGFPSRLAYACVVKSDRIAQKVQSAAVKEPEALTGTSPTGQPIRQSPLEPSAFEESLQKRLGAAAAGIRRNPDPVLAEALALRS